MDDPKRTKHTVRGKIIGIDHDRRSMLIREFGSGGGTYTDFLLKWEPVMDDVMRREKIGNRSVVDTITDLTQQNPQPLIIGIRFDEKFREKHPEIRNSADEILIMSCFRTGARVFGCTVTPDTEGYESVMDMLMNRAIKDAKTIKEEAKKL